MKDSQHYSATITGTLKYIKESNERFSTAVITIIIGF